MSKLSFREWSILSDLQIIDSIQEDYEFSMARSELKTAQAAISRLMRHLKGEGDLEAWIQSKITKAADYIDTVADYIDSGESETTKTTKEEWSEKYKRSIDCDHPKGFSQRAHCQGKKKKVKEDVELDEALKSHHSVDQIAKKHRLDVSFVQNQLDMGIKIEHEHVTDKDTAMDIALQHLDEIPDYYTRLKKMEASAKKSHKKYKDVEVEENVDILDADGNLFARITDLIKGTDDKFKGFTNMEEDLRRWFGKDDEGGVGGGGWDRYNTKGERIGKCARENPNEAKPKCLSKEKAKQLRSQGGAKAIANAVKRKRKQDPISDRSGKGEAPIMVSNKIKEEYIEEKNVPTNPSLWSRMKARAKSKFDVYPSAYANGWAAKEYKKAGGGWKSVSENTDYSENDDLDNPVVSHEKKIHFHDGVIRYCPMCQKGEKASECKYGEKYWRMFSHPIELSPKEFSIATVHPTNMPESKSFEISHTSQDTKKALRQKKIETLATRTNNPGEQKAAQGKLAGPKWSKPSLKYEESIIQPGQLTTEDYQRLQSSGNVYTIMFSWRSKPPMKVQLFFGSSKRPSKMEVDNQIQKIYPGARVLSYYPTPADPNAPIVVIQK